jgi:hypothetical protein
MAILLRAILAVYNLHAKITLLRRHKPWKVASG